MFFSVCSLDQGSAAKLMVWLVILISCSTDVPNQIKKNDFQEMENKMTNGISFYFICLLQLSVSLKAFRDSEDCLKDVPAGQKTTGLMCGQGSCGSCG